MRIILRCKEQLDAAKSKLWPKILLDKELSPNDIAIDIAYIEERFDKFLDSEEVKMFVLAHVIADSVVYEKETENALIFASNIAFKIDEIKEGIELKIQEYVKKYSRYVDFVCNAYKENKVFTGESNLLNLTVFKPYLLLLKLYLALIENSLSKGLSSRKAVENAMELLKVTSTSYLSKWCAPKRLEDEYLDLVVVYKNFIETYIEEAKRETYFSAVKTLADYIKETNS